MSSLVIIRHGQSVYNQQNRFTGIVDVELSDLGRSEALSAAGKLKGNNFNFSDAFVSVLQRAKETLSIILKEIDTAGKIKVHESAALNERAYGDLQGLNKAETAQKYSDEQVYEWRRSFAATPPGGESLSQTYDRVIPYYNNSIKPVLSKGNDVLIVAHGNSLRALMMLLENFSPEKIAEVEIATAAPRAYRFDENMKVVEVKYL
ncbi:MAG: 2,3-bisphosphoglycerate-dependent phosphoglycerate mutase [Bacteroidota bacterium]